MDLPTTRTSPFDPPRELTGRPALSRLNYPDGTTGWLATRHADAKQLLADPRMSASADRVRSPIRAEQQPAAPGAFAFMDPPDHTRYRKLLTGQFTVRRMRTLEEAIAKRAADLAKAMSTRQPPADLVTQFALPLPSLTICELLGVPYKDHEFFEENSKHMVDPDMSLEQRDAAGNALMGYLYELVSRKQADPEDDILSSLTELGTEEVTGIAIMLLFAGHETTANMLALGTFALLQHPDQLARLRQDPGLIDNAVEELLRYLSIVQYEVNRAALADIEIGGETIKAGESVLISVPAANRDPAKFERPDDLDITRPATGHVAFGHGIHQCLGQQLARIEMRAGYLALLRQFPGLRLAVPADEVPLNTSRGIYGVASLPVAW
jgi:cytochrome P450